MQLLLEPIGAAIDAALSTIKQIVVLAVATPSVGEIPVQVQEGSMSVRVEVRACEVLLVEDAAAALIGTPVDAAALEKLGSAAMAACNPIDDKRGTVEYRTKVAGVLARRAAEKALERARTN